jgi:tetratricopeptide (TPR) repeat protein
VQPGTRLGPYEIVAPIGAGGMGEVYRARDTRLERDVAIKVLPAAFASDPERLRRFEQETRAVAALSHPNVLAVYDVGTHEAIPYLVTELLEGESLRDRLRGGGLTVRKAVETAVQIAQGLAAAHEKGIVHRDLKPANVFLTRDGQVKILDFGLAKLVAPRSAVEPAQASTVVEATEAGTRVGTVGYMSPEQIRGKSVDHRTDIFAFGCVLYEILFGDRAFSRDTAADTMSAILHEDPPALTGTGRGIPPTLQGIVRRCLEKRPEDRFGSARDVAFALEAITGETEPPVVPSKRSWIARHRLAVAAAGAAVAIVAALALWRPWHAASAPVTSGPGHIPSILALPCKVYGAPEVAFLTEAVPATISTILAQVEGLDTKVPPTSFEVEKVKGDLATLAELYQVSSFIVTSINTSAGGFALNVELVDAATRKVRWGKQYEGSREAYNELARQAAEGIRQAVKVAASPVPTSGVSSEAELALREGDYFLHRYGALSHSSDFTSALEAYQRAMKANPSLATVAAAIGLLYELKFEAEGEASGARKEWETWARRALELDPRCGQAWTLLSMMEWYTTKPNIERQIEYALKAAAFAPRDGPCHMAVSNAVQSPGALSLQLAAGLRAVEVDPFHLGANLNVVVDLSALGRAGEAVPFADRAMRVEPEASASLNARGYMLLKLGRLDEARTTLARWEPHFREHPESFYGGLWGQVRFQVAAAERDAATMEKLERSIVAPLLDGRADAETLGNGTWFVCPALALLGRTDESLRILLRSVEMGVPPPYDLLLYEPGFQPLRSDPRFAKVVTASRDGAARIARILEQSRTRGELPSYLNQPLDELVKLLNETGAKS